MLSRNTTKNFLKVGIKKKKSRTFQITGGVVFQITIRSLLSRINLVIVNRVIKLLHLLRVIHTNSNADSFKLYWILITQRYRFWRDFRVLHLVIEEEVPDILGPRKKSLLLQVLSQFFHCIHTFHETFRKFQKFRKKKIESCSDYYRHGIIIRREWGLDNSESIVA